MKRIVVAISGTDKIGKKIVTEHLKNIGFIYFSIKVLLEDFLGFKGLKKNQENLRKVARELREERGIDVLVKIIRNRANARNANRVIIGHLRYPEEHEYLIERAKEWDEKYYHIAVNKHKLNPKNVLNDCVLTPELIFNVPIGRVFKRKEEEEKNSLEAHVIFQDLIPTALISSLDDWLQTI
ncbi:MAG: hypothetical protein WCW87_00760 [Candidatus Paceibacterota bacterium]